MTRKDYVLIATALAAAKPSIDDFTKTSPDGNNTLVNSMAHGFAADQWRDDRDSIADALEAENPDGFDRSRFITAAKGA